MTKLNFSQFFTQNCLKIMGKVLREAIATFYSLHHAKGKPYTFKHFKNAASKATIIRRIKQKIQNMDISPIVKMFDGLKEKIRKADENGLRSLTKM